MDKERLGRIAVVAVLVFLVGLLVGRFLPGGNSGLGARKVYSTSVVLRQVQTLSQLVTVKYVMEKVQIVEDPPQNFWRQLLPDNSRVILVAHGVVKAGIDLHDIKPGDLRISGKRVMMRLPVPQILDAYLDEKHTQVIERNTGFLRTFNKDLEQITRQNAIEDIRRAARSSGILKDADERAREQLTRLFEQLGFEEVEFTNP